MDAPAVTVRCPCGHAFKVAVQGEQVTCPACKKAFRIPSPLPASEKPKTPSSSHLKRPPTTAMAPPPHDLIPGYLIQKRLGSGGMGDVYLAKQVSLDRMVALKLLPDDLAKDKMFVETFMKEARSAAKVSHENIVGAVDFGEANGRYYFVMEKVEGDTLYRHIRKGGAMSEARALDFARQIAHGLRHAHKHGLIHRDIKPQNIMITPEKKAKILDFGLARDVRKEKQAGKPEFIVSTPAYASPEQCTGESSIDHRTDMYSLGVTLYEMLTGRRPFTADTARRIMKKQVTDAPTPPQTVHREVSQEANDLVLRMLQKDPKERFQNYDELISEIERVAGGAPPATDVTPPVMKRLPMPALIGGGAAAAAVLVLILVLLFSGGEEQPAPGPASKAPAAVRDPEVMKLLADTRALEKNARKPSEWVEVLAAWRKLERKYRGTPNHSQFSTPRLEFEEKINEKANVIAAEFLSDANHKETSNRLNEAYEALARFPSELNFTPAQQKIAARKLEIERKMDRVFRERMRQIEDIALNDRFEEARNLLVALRASLAVLGSGGTREVFKRYADPMDRLHRDIDAAARAAKAPMPVVNATPTAKPAPAPAPAPDATPAPAAIQPIVPTPPDYPPDNLAHFAALHDPAKRADGRRPAAAFFEAAGSASALYRAAAVFLQADERMWMLQGKVGEALKDYLPHTIVPGAEAITPDQHRSELATLAAKIQACGDVPVHALQLFACAHIRELLDKKEAVDPAVALQARLGQGAISKIWGPSQHVGRVEMAGMLVRRPGLWLPRAADAATRTADFASKYLGTLCVVKQASIPVDAAEDRWRQLAADAPSPEWSRTCEAVADRIKDARSCGVCDAKGRYPCGFCSGTGAIMCPTCGGAGTVIENPGTENAVKKKCSACRSRRAVPCVECKAKRNVTCMACGGKRRRARVPGSKFRYVVDLAVCSACEGRGTPLAGTGFPCFTCGGNGRALDRVPREFAKLPPWIEDPVGHAVFMALRWLARHQAPDGSWSSNGWKSACPEKGCGDLPGDGFDLGVTSIALMAFLDAGFDAESKVELGGVEAGGVVLRALAWLLKAQNSDSGHIAAGGGGSTPKPVFEHLLAAYALADAAVRLEPGKAFSQNDHDRLRQAVHGAARDALSTQVKNGGWRYTSGPESDTWVSCWGGMALLAAREAGVDVPRLNFQYLLRWLDSTTDKKAYFVGYNPALMGKVSLSGQEAFVHHPTLTAYGALVRMLIEGRPSATAKAADALLKQDLPSPEPLKRDYSYWYAATKYLAHRTKGRGTDWSRWTGALGRELLLIQESKDDCALGSWPGKERWIPMGGRIYAAAMNALTLEYAGGLRPQPVKRR